jgi:hypothetical protein
LLIGNTFDYNAVAATNMTNNIYSAGGGAYISSADLTALGNSFSHNTITGYIINGVGFIINFTASAKVSGNVISMNTAISPYSWWGVGCQCAHAQGPVTFTGNEFSLNTGSSEGYGVGTGLNITYAYWNKISISGNIFRENINQWFGGGFYSRDNFNLTVQNNIFDGNQSRSGGAVGINIPASVDLWRPVFINNTFVNNSTFFRGGAIHMNCQSNLPIFINSVFHNNSSPLANNISFEGSTNPIHISFCAIDTIQISGPWTGEGNFSADPEFIPGDPLYHLGLTSPCKNAGTPSLEVDGTVYYAPLTDFDGETRPDPQYNLFDVGADERWEVPPAPVALTPELIGEDYFIAQWEPVSLAMGYFLDMAYDASFSNMVPGYDNLDVGGSTSYTVENLEPVDYYYRVRSYNALFTSENSNVIDVLTVGIPQSKIKNRKSEIAIFPNPFTRQTTIGFTLQQSGHVQLAIYNQMGKQVAVLMDEYKPAGLHEVSWNAAGMPAGIYLCRLNTGQQIYSCKIIKYH